MNLIRRSTVGSRLGVLFAMAAASSLRLQGAAAGGLPWEKPMTAIATSLFDRANLVLGSGKKVQKVEISRGHQQ